RSAFVKRHHGVLVALAAAGAGLGALGALRAGPRALLPLAAAPPLAPPHRPLDTHWRGAGPPPLLPLAAALPLALAHRRLKRIWMAKAFYVTAGWLLVVVGVPAAGA